MAVTAGDAIAEISAPTGPPRYDDAELFVAGNTLFTVYHELGHAFIDLLNLPVVGREEDAVDGFAAVMMIPAEPDPIRDELIIAVADGWRLKSDAANTLADQGSLWGEHALDQQRHYAIVCLMVGSDQEGFFDFAIESGLPPERIAGCADNFHRMKTGWDRLLVRHRAEVDAIGASTRAPVGLVFDAPGPDEREAFRLAQTGGLVEQAIDGLDARLRLPAPVTVRFASCGEANAHWARDRQEVVICYALLNDFLSILLGPYQR